MFCSDKLEKNFYKTMMSGTGFSAQKKRQHSLLNASRKVETQRTWHVLSFH